MASRLKRTIPTLQSLCLDAIASALIEDPARFANGELGVLPSELAEQLQQILIRKNSLNDATLVSSTSSRQTSMTIPFSMSSDDECISTDALLQALTVRTMSWNLHIHSLLHPKFFAPNNSAAFGAIFETHSRFCPPRLLFSFWLPTIFCPIAIATHVNLVPALPDASFHDLCVLTIARLFTTSFLAVPNDFKSLGVFPGVLFRSSRELSGWWLCRRRQGPSFPGDLHSFEQQDFLALLGNH